MTDAGWRDFDIVSAGERSMRRVLFLSAAMLIGMSGAAWAACTAETRVSTDLTTLFLGKRIQAAGGTGSWHEHHGASNVLTECAQGSTSTVDPTHVVGMWTINSPGTQFETITYDYGGTNKFEFTVHSNGGSNYSFCQGATERASGNLVSGVCP
jgi:hypothetical protein